MSKFFRFKELPLKSIKPRGWIREFLLRQRNGLTGYLDEQFFPWNTCGWTGTIPEKKLGHAADWWDCWWPYEQTAYLYDGQIKTAILLDDNFLLEKVLRQTRYVIENQSKDGYLGPDHIRHTRWPHAVFFRSLMAEYSAFGNKRILDAISRHYSEDCKNWDYANGRDVTHIEGICWVYEHSGKKEFLELAEKIWNDFEKRNFFKPHSVSGLLSNLQPFEHGVTFFETLKLPAILYGCNNNKKYLEASINGLEKVDRYHMLPDGIPSSEEYLNGIFVKSAHETCVISDYIWATGYVLLSSGMAKWADRIEKAIFNAFFGAVMPDFKAHQYLSSPNQIVSTSSTDYDEYRLQYRASHPTLCCTGNVNRILPNYIIRMWLYSDDGIVAAMYGPSEVSFQRDGIFVKIIEETDYPFDDKVIFKIVCNRTVRFSLYLRIPGWCSEAKISFNGRVYASSCARESFVKIEEEFNNNDEIVIKLPMKLDLFYWPSSSIKGGIKVGASFSYGPLTLSYPVPFKKVVDTTPERFTITTSNEDYPAWNLLPNGEWRYGVENTEKILKYCKVLKDSLNGKFPFDEMVDTIKVKIPVRVIKDWDLICGVKDGSSFISTPPLPEKINKNGKRDIFLVPYGKSKLRLTVFPVII